MQDDSNTEVTPDDSDNEVASGTYKDALMPVHVERKRCTARSRVATDTFIFINPFEVLEELYGECQTKTASSSYDSQR